MLSPFLFLIRMKPEVAKMWEMCAGKHSRSFRVLGPGFYGLPMTPIGTLFQSRQSKALISILACRKGLLSLWLSILHIREIVWEMSPQ